MADNPFKGGVLFDGDPFGDPATWDKVLRDKTSLTIDYVAGPGATEPTRGTEGAAGWDLYAAEDFELKPYESALIPAKIAAALPEGTVLFIVPRSGFSTKNQIIMTNSVGIWDEDFRGEVKLTAMWCPHPADVMRIKSTEEKTPDGDQLFTLSLERFPDLTFQVKKGDRIAQAVLLEYKAQQWRAKDELPATARGHGGIGSTGIRSGDASGPPTDPKG